MLAHQVPYKRLRLVGSGQAGDLNAAPPGCKCPWIDLRPAFGAMSPARPGGCHLPVLSARREIDRPLGRAYLTAPSVGSSAHADSASRTQSETGPPQVQVCNRETAFRCIELSGRLAEEATVTENPLGRDVRNEWQDSLAARQSITFRIRQACLPLGTAAVRSFSGWWPQSRT